MKTLLLLSAFVTLAISSTPASADTKGPPSCTISDRAASITRAAVPERPAIAQADGLTGTSIVRVDLDESGHVRATSIRSSSGTPILDWAAEKTVRAMQYSPELHECKGVAGSYAVEVNFDN